MSVEKLEINVDYSKGKDKTIAVYAIRVGDTVEIIKIEKLIVP